MSRIPSYASTASPSSQTQGDTDLREVDMDQFLRLLITELQNQDPLNPMENSEILQQISQIREIGATNLLSETLASVMAGQNLATASSLIGKHVSALTDEGENVEGVVQRVSVETDEANDGQRILRIQIDGKAISLDNVRSIVGE